MEDLNNRAHPRAPLEGDIIGSYDDKLFQSKTLNVSEAGILFEEIPQLELGAEVYVLFDLPVIKDFSKLRPEKLMSLHRDDFQRSVIRLKAKVTRHFKGKNPIGEGDVQQTAIEFIDIAPEIQEHIRKYVNRFKVNLEILLNDIEEMGKSNTDSSRLKKISYLLGYGEVHKLAILRQRVSHHYQGLQ